MKNTLSIMVAETDTNNLKLIKNNLNLLNEFIASIKYIDCFESISKAIEKSKPDLMIININLTDKFGYSLMHNISEINIDIIVVDNNEFYKLLATEYSQSGLIFKKIDIIQYCREKLKTK